MGFKEKLYTKVWVGKPEDFYNSVEVERESNWRYEPIQHDDTVLKKIEDMCEDIKSIKEALKELERSFIMEVDEQGIIRIRKFDTMEERVKYIYGKRDAN